MFLTPVIHLFFNRPELTRGSFAAIRAARLRRLHLIADGPRPVQALLPVVPSLLKETGKRLVSALSGPAPSPAPAAAPLPRVTQELALLQQCAWKLPFDRATARFGYRPAVTFPTGMHRSLGWLAFAEGLS